MWKAVRIFILLILLAKAIQITVLEEMKLNWKKIFYVTVYPINADGSNEVSAYINSLKQNDFEPVSDYFAKEGAFYHLPIKRPIEIYLGAPVAEIPPAPPIKGNVLQIIIWSLKFRFYDWMHSTTVQPKPDIKLYLLYYDPLMQPSLSHSTALHKGRIGRVNLFGDPLMHEQNLVILAHELLHTVKASDKYDIYTNLPIFPEGYAEPIKNPLLPQQYAELMGGRIPMTQSSALIPYALEQTKIGVKTAKEIGWVK